MQRQFTYEQRLEAVLLYVNKKLSSREIGKQLQVDHSVIERWINLYKIHGAEGLTIRTNHKEYDESFKEKVVLEIQNKQITQNKATTKYRLSSSTIKRWCVQYSQGKLMKEKEIVTQEQAELIRKKYKNTKDPELRKILERNEYLEMENEILKKLKALTEQQPKKK